MEENEKKMERNCEFNGETQDMDSNDEVQLKKVIWRWNGRILEEPGEKL